MSSTTANIPTTGQWISVKDRMPDELQVVLVHGKHENEYYSGFGVTWIDCGRWVGDVHRVCVKTIFKRQVAQISRT